MTRTIYKYPLPLDEAANGGGQITLTMPEGSEILHLDTQHGDPQLWAMVPLGDLAVEKRHIAVVGTGHWVPEGEVKHLGSIMLNGGTFVFHFFEVVK